MGINTPYGSLLLSVLSPLIIRFLRKSGRVHVYVHAHTHTHTLTHHSEIMTTYLIFSFCFESQCDAPYWVVTSRVFFFNIIISLSFYPYFVLIVIMCLSAIVHVAID